MNGFTHLEAVMGTIVGVTSPETVPPAALERALGELHRADRVFSTFEADSPISRLRAGQVRLSELEPADAALVGEVLELCARARDITGGAFDPWAMPGGVDPTGLVKGWATQRALSALASGGVVTAMVNAGGDIAVVGQPGDRPWRVGVRHPGQPDAYCLILEVDGGAVATSGDYERPGELIDPGTGRIARGASSATVTGPDLALADALATGLAVGGGPVLAAIDALPAYEAHLITPAGRHYATGCLPLAA